MSFSTSMPLKLYSNQFEFYCIFIKQYTDSIVYHRKIYYGIVSLKNGNLTSKQMFSPSLSQSNHKTIQSQPLPSTCEKNQHSSLATQKKTYLLNNHILFVSILKYQRAFTWCKNDWKNIAEVTRSLQVLKQRFEEKSKLCFVGPEVCL